MSSDDEAAQRQQDIQMQMQLAQNQRQLHEQAAERFSQTVADLFMAVEELRQSIPSSVGPSTTSSSANGSSSSPASTPITVDLVLQWQHQVDHLLQILNHMARFAIDASAAVATGSNDTTISVMHQHAVTKAIVVAQQVLALTCLQYVEPTEKDANVESENDGAALSSDPGFYSDSAAPLSIDEQRRNGQGAAARLAEVNLVLCCMYNDVCQTSSSSTANGSTTGGNMNQHEEIQSLTDIVALYVQYQRQVLRTRSKPPIAQLVQERRKGTFDNSSTSTVTSVLANGHHAKAAPIVAGGTILKADDDEDDEDTDENGTINKKPTLQLQDQQHHAPVLTLVLGEAASLIHPLATWKAHIQSSTANDSNNPLNSALLQLCTDAIRTLDDQAQALAKTVSDWFWQDRPVDSWIQQSSLLDAGEVGSGGYNDDVTTSSMLIAAEDKELALARLDALVEEMAYASQVFERYQSLLASTDIGTTATTAAAIVTHELLPEWTIKYGALERFLALQQWQAALQHAVPVTIVMGTEIRVPSVVEDAQYLSTRALERAASTRSLQAVATVAYAICHDVWSTEVVDAESNGTHGPSSSAVYQALLDEMGCWSDAESSLAVQDKKKDVTATPAPSSGGFAAALLDALDDDIASEQKPQSPKKKPPKAPSSGNFLSSLVSGDQDKIQQQQLDTLYCLLNGMHAVSGASRSLVAFLDDLLLEKTDVADTAETRKATSMIQLSREELARYSDTYEKLLTGRINESLIDWCGDVGNSSSSSTTPRSKKNSLCFFQLAQFFEQESYQLDGNSIGPAESTERLDKDMVGPLRRSKFLCQLPDKCEGEVLQVTAERVAATVVDIVLGTLWRKDEAGMAAKKFTDWGALLLSTQSRMLQSFISTTMLQPSVSQVGGSVAAPAGPKLLQVWERLSQVIAILQLEKPSDWLAYQASSRLSADELAQTLALRIDFSADAIEKVVSSIDPHRQVGLAAGNT